MACYKYRDAVAESLIGAIRKGGKKFSDLVLVIEKHRVREDKVETYVQPSMDPTVGIQFEAVVWVTHTVRRIWDLLASKAKLIKHILEPCKFVKAMKTIASGEQDFYRRFDPCEGRSFLNTIVVPIMMLTQSVSLLNYLIRLTNRFLRHRTNIGYHQILSRVISTVNASLWTIYHRIKDFQKLPDFYLIQSNSSFYMLLNDTIFVSSPWIVRQTARQQELPKITSKQVEARIADVGEAWVKFHGM